MNGHLYYAARTPPANLAAEQALLGALLANNRAYDQVVDFLRPDHFADPRHGRIYEAIARRVDGAQLADAVTLRAEWASTGELERNGGADYLGRLLAAMVSVKGAGDYGRAVHDAWHRRRLIEIADAMRDRAYFPEDATGAQIQDEAETALFELAERGGADVAVPAHAAMATAIDAAAKASTRPGGLIGLTTGFAALDEITGGLRRGQYTLLAARPSMGKTSLALAMAAAAAAAQARVLFVSREMPAQAIGAKLAAGLAAVPAEAADRGKLRSRDELGRWQYQPIGAREIDAMTAAQRAMASRTLIIDECRPATVAAVRSRARREARRGGLDLVVIDYLGLMRVPEMARSDNRTLEVTRLSEQCKALAVDLDVPVLVLAQLNRGPEGREDKRPSLGDLRDSGALEQDADIVAFLYREHYYLTRQPAKRRPGEAEEHYERRAQEWLQSERAARGVAEVIIAKQRMGPVGTRRLAFHESSVWFGDLEGE